MGQKCGRVCCPCLKRYRESGTDDPHNSKNGGAADGKALEASTALLAPTIQKRPSVPAIGIDHVVRVVLVGDSQVGKTCLLRRYLNDYYDAEDEADYTHTLGVDFGRKTVELQNRKVRLQMWDTGGDVKHLSVVSHYLRGADGVVLVYDVTNPASFESLRTRWIPFLREHAPPGVKLLLVGNKADADEGDKGVDSVAAQDFADAQGIALFEASARDGTNVDFAMLTLLREVMSSQTGPEECAADSAPKDQGLWKTIFGATHNSPPPESDGAKYLKHLQSGYMSVNALDSDIDEIDLDELIGTASSTPHPPTPATVASLKSKFERPPQIQTGLGGFTSPGRGRTVQPSSGAGLGKSLPLVARPTSPMA